MDLQEQVNAYTAWINSQLKKRSQQIQDLSLDLKDGYALATVIEIVSGEKLDAVKPTNKEEQNDNLVKILKFMKQSGIKLHHISVEDIVAGNVKTIMQLILALAAHFKPSSIGGRKHNYVEKSHRSPATNPRWKKSCEGDSSPHMMGDTEHELQMELETDLSNVRQLAEDIQRILMDELEQQPIQDPHPFEESSIIQAKLDKITCERERLLVQYNQIQSETHNIRMEKSVLETRVNHHEQEILALRQDLMRSNLEKDRLLSEKAELTAELGETHSQRDRYLKQAHRKELLVQELKDEIRFSQTEHVILMSRKDKEIAKLQKQINHHSNLADEDYPDSSIMNFSHSPVFSHSHGCLRSNPSPKLSRRSPLSKSNPSKKNRYQHKQSEAEPTRVLYFSDCDMTPSMTSISKSVGDITLQDFKDATNKEGHFRYIFKALDPELGTVKEEVFRNDDILPGWEGKIVAWIEEEVRV